MSAADGAEEELTILDEPGDPVSSSANDVTGSQANGAGKEETPAEASLMVDEEELHQKVASVVEKVIQKLGLQIPKESSGQHLRNLVRAELEVALEGSPGPRKRATTLVQPAEHIRGRTVKSPHKEELVHNNEKEASSPNPSCAACRGAHKAHTCGKAKRGRGRPRKEAAHCNSSESSSSAACAACRGAHVAHICGKPLHGRKKQQVDQKDRGQTSPENASQEGPAASGGETRDKKLPQKEEVVSIASSDAEQTEVDKAEEEEAFVPSDANSEADKEFEMARKQPRRRRKRVGAQALSDEGDNEDEPADKKSTTRPRRADGESVEKEVIGVDSGDEAQEKQKGKRPVQKSGEEGDSKSDSQGDRETQAPNSRKRGRLTRAVKSEDEGSDEGEEPSVRKKRAVRKRQSQKDEEEEEEEEEEVDSESAESESSMEADRVGDGRKRKKIRKPQQLSADIKKAAEEGRKADEEREKIRAKAAGAVGEGLTLEGLEEGKDVVLPERIAQELQPHQRVGAKFLWQCAVREGRGCILAHCMGLGKTLQTLTVLNAVYQARAQVKEKHNTAASMLVLAPVNVLRNWLVECERWLGDDEDAPEVWLMADMGKTNKERREALQEWSESGGIMLMGYEQFRNLASGKGMPAVHKKAFKSLLLDPGPFLVACDEGHILRNAKSGVSKAVQDIQSKRRVVLTGTPLQNNLIEYHCMVDFVRPGLLDTQKVFKRDFVEPILNGQCVDSTPSDVRLMRHRSHVLHDLLKGCVDRADYKVLQSYLPNKHEFVIAIRMSDLQARLYRAYLEKHMTVSSSDGAMQAASVNAKTGVKLGVQLFRSYHSFSKIWTHPAVLSMSKAESRDSMDDFIASDESEATLTSDSSDDDEDKKRKSRLKERNSNKKKKDADQEDVASEDSSDWWEEMASEIEKEDLLAAGKILFLMQMLREAAKAGDKCLVFSQSLVVLDLIEDAMLEEHEARNKDEMLGWIKGRDYFRLDGSTEGLRRQKDIDKYNSSKRARCFLISTKAGSLGVNLPSANRVVIMDASWNPSYDAQAIFRSYRIGQEKDVFVYRLLSHGTMEEKIYGRQVTKQALASRVVDSEETGRHFTENELKALFEFTPGKTREQVRDERVSKAGAGDVKAETGAEGAKCEEKGKEEEATNGREKQQEDGGATASGQGATGKGKEAKSASNSKITALVTLPPKDDLLARVMAGMIPEWIVGYHESDSLIEIETKLSPEEVEAAWAEFREREERLRRQQAEEAQRRLEQFNLKRQEEMRLAANLAAQNRLMHMGLPGGGWLPPGMQMPNMPMMGHAQHFPNGAAPGFGGQMGRAQNPAPPSLPPAQHPQAPAPNAGAVGVGGKPMNQFKAVPQPNAIKDGMVTVTLPEKGRIRVPLPADWKEGMEVFFWA